VPKSTANTLVNVHPVVVGICGSDTQKVSAGHDIDTLGHEIVGIAMLDGVRQRVAVNPLISCQKCEYCTSGRAMFCRSLRVIGRDQPGALAGTFDIPRRNLVVLPEDLDDETAVLADPYAVVWHGARLHPRLHDTGSILIIGDGVMAMLQLLYLAFHSHASQRYTVVAKNEARVHALQKWFMSLQLPNVKVAFVTALHKDDEFDIAVETVGRNQTETFTLALDHLVPRGSAVHYGVYPLESLQTIPMRTMMYKEILVQGVNSYIHEDFEAAVDDLSAHTDVFNSIIGPRFSFEARRDAIEAACDKMRPIANKIIMKMEQS